MAHVNKRARKESRSAATNENRNKGTLTAPSVVLSAIDKAPQLILSDDSMECFGTKGGYRMVRATHGVHSGTYLWELEILPSKVPDSHVRLGWSARKGELQGPVGYDKHSFGFRDIDGSKVHNSCRTDFYGDPFGVGDIIGSYIKLDSTNSENNEIRFFKNGIDQGIAFKGAEIASGVYTPAISLFMKAHVRVNFGPSFILKYDIPVNAMSEVQPMSIDDRRNHEARISSIRQERAKTLVVQPQLDSSNHKLICGQVEQCSSLALADSTIEEDIVSVPISSSNSSSL